MDDDLHILESPPPLDTTKTTPTTTAGNKNKNRDNDQVVGEAKNKKYRPNASKVWNYF